MPPPPPPPLRYVSGGKRDVAHKLAATAPTPPPSSPAPRFEEFDASPSVVYGAFDRLQESTYFSKTRRPDVATRSSTRVTDKQSSPSPTSSPEPVSLRNSSARTASSSSKRVSRLLRLLKDLTAENALLQQRICVLMEGETRDDAVPGIPTAASPCSGTSAEREALLLRIRRLEAALKVEAMEREALEVRLQAQERVLTKLVKR